MKIAATVSGNQVEIKWNWQQGPRFGLRLDNDKAKIYGRNHETQHAPPISSRRFIPLWLSSYPLDDFTLMQIAAIIFIALGTLATLVVFVRSRAREGIHPLETTNKDKTEFREMRRELGVRRVFGSFIGMSGALLILAGIASPLYSDLFARAGWHSVVYLIALGLILVLCAVPLIRKSR